MATPTTAAMSIDAAGYQLTARFKFSDCTGTPPTGAIEVGPVAGFARSFVTLIGKDANSILVPRRDIIKPSEEDIEEFSCIGLSDGFSRYQPGFRL